VQIDRPEVIGVRLKTLREALGYDQARAFCQFVGFSDQALYNYETGKRRISLDEAAKVVSKTGATLDWVYFGVEHSLPFHLAEKLRQVDA